MLKFLFWMLLFANAALYAYREGHLETFFPSGREPARLKNQLNADKIQLLPPEPAAEKTGTPPPSQAPAPAPAPAAPGAAPSPAPARAPAVSEGPAAAQLACTEIGDFNLEDARRFETQLAGAALAERASRRVLREAVSYVVHIPPQAGKEGADKKTAELRGLGVTDSYIIQDNSPLRWGISLGVFKTEEGARAHLASLTLKGVRSARILTRNAGTVAIQLRDLDAGMKAKLDAIKREFPKQEERACARAA